MEARIFVRPLMGVLCLQLLTTNVSAHALDPIPDHEVDARLAELRHEPLSESLSEKVVRNDGICTYTKVEIPVVDPRSGEKRSKVVHVTRPSTERAVPAVIIVPTIEGHTIMENHIAESFCKTGIAGLITNVTSTELPAEMPSWHHEDGNSRWAVLTLRTVIDYTQSRPSTYLSDRVGMMGMSLGAIMTGMVGGVDDRLNAVYLAAGGGNLPDILSWSVQKEVVDLRKRRMRHVGINEIAQYEDVLRENVRFDPLYFASRTQTSKFRMMMVKNDKKVPEANQRELWQALGQPDVTWMSNGHAGSIIFLAYTKFKIVREFFEQKLMSR
jgi:dienelactone hydrolase